VIQNWTKVFRFTLQAHMRARGYLISTILVAFLLFLAIPGILLFADSQSGSVARFTEIALAVHTDGLDYAPLRQMDMDVYAGVVYQDAANLDEAKALCEGNPYSVILAVDGGVLTVILPDNTEIPESDAAAFGTYLSSVYPFLAPGANAAEPAYSASALAAAPADMADSVRSVFAMVLPYVVMMLLYFMMLIYGQGVANGVIMEKTSKLMDLFLVSVRPAAMILGKTLSIALAGILQACIWMGAAVGGFALGHWLVELVNPQTTLGIISFFDLLGSMSGLFTPAGFALAVAILIAGFLMYCALASIGGAMAGKPEDLSVTNILFTIVLVGSFFACIFTGESAGMVSSSPILNYIPFTAILVAPSHVLLGDMTIAQGLLSLGLIAAFAFVLVLLAGKIYTMMAFYRGNPPTPAKMLNMLKTGSRAMR
jgi:ABC-type Na+ efflux pump permease subunit